MDPLLGLWPVHHDFMLGKQSWMGSNKGWIEQLRHSGRWPLEHWCGQCRHVLPIWPSRLRSLAAGARGEIITAYTCTGCDQLQVGEFHASQLHYCAS